MKQNPSWTADSHSAGQEITPPPTFQEWRRFITLFTSASHWTLSWASWVQSISSQPTSL